MLHSIATPPRHTSAATKATPRHAGAATRHAGAATKARRRTDTGDAASPQRSGKRGFDRRGSHAQPEGYACQLRAVADGRWQVIAVIQMVPRAGVVTRMREQLDEVARTLEGEYAGWDAPFVY